MNRNPPRTARLLLTEPDGLGRIHVDMEAFFEFSFWLAEELEDLVARWALRAVRPTGPPSRWEKRLRR